MKRRGFLSLLSGFALDPDRVLWVPGAKAIVIPAPRSRNVLIPPAELSARILAFMQAYFAGRLPADALLGDSGTTSPSTSLHENR